MRPLHGVRTASTTPINFSVARESRNWLGGVLFLFFGATLSCNIFTFILTNSIKAAELRKSVRSASYLTTQTRPLSLLQLSKPRYLSIRPPTPVSFDWVGISLVSFNQAPPPQYLSTGWVFPWYLSTRPPSQYLSTGRQRVPATPPKKTHDHNWELGETYPNSSVLSEEADGRKQPLLVPRLRFLVEFRRRREVQSGSLIRGRHNCWLKIYIYARPWELWIKFYLGQNENCSPGDSVSDNSEKLLWGGEGRSQDI